jgi:uncharacterized protein (TIGR02444 family)
MARFPDCAFWDFSVEVYARPGVAPACLDLQERRGADVNLLLFACWHGASGRGALDGPLLAAARERVATWHEEVIRPLRTARRRLKSDPGPPPTVLRERLRRKIAADELEAEHLEQLALAALAPPEPTGLPTEARQAQDAAQGALAYLSALGTPPEEADRSSLIGLLSGCFPAVSLATLTAAVAA